MFNLHIAMPVTQIEEKKNRKEIENQSSWYNSSIATQHTALANQIVIEMKLLLIKVFKTMRSVTPPSEIGFQFLIH